MAAHGNWAETGVGAVVLAAAGAFLIYALSAGAVGRHGGGYEVKARFGQVGALAAGSDVRLAGVKIGTVTRIALDPKTFLAEADLSLDPAIKIPADSTAKITSDSLLGGSHIAIAPGGAAENLKPGSEIQNTQGAVDIFGLIGQVLRPQSGETPASGAPASGAAAAQAPAASY
ncbi:MAG TPA: outer membrane lipid asymmetry maintenance protein MlaD [Caulobacteraceae bacterium]|jgi:phospholipid/cholesterol/gamma-HCH transport system substrate-binding protein|nr:outer membrane lipid asymmetry maintenance protein MlaD [Caulobacteraceae bacterium]